MSARPDIRPLQAIDAPWLTAVLREAGVDAKVSRFAAQSVGTGQIGDSVRFRLAYDSAPDDAPKTLVGKFPAATEESRATGVALGNYLREVRFYQELAADALVSTPRCWFADVEPETGEFVLMMEDLAPATQGDQLAGVTLDQAKQVMLEAARLHASHWDDPRLDELPWVSGSKAAPPSVATEETVRALWEGFKARYDGSLHPHWIEAGDWLAGEFMTFAARHDGPRCLTHNDFRPDNMMFGAADGGRPVTVLDWQSFAYGTGATDVAYFLAGGLPREVRRKHEDELLDLYHGELTRLGVAGYSREALKRDYARGGYLLFGTAFFAGMIVTRTERGDRMFLQMLGSAADHMRDHGLF